MFKAVAGELMLNKVFLVSYSTLFLCILIIKASFDLIRAEKSNHR